MPRIIHSWWRCAFAMSIIRCRSAAAASASRPYDRAASGMWPFRTYRSTGRPAMRSASAWIAAWTRWRREDVDARDAPGVDVGLQPDDVDLDHGSAEVDRRADTGRGERRV